MKILYLISLLLFLTNCSAHSVKIGKRCTTAGIDGSFEKSFIWFVDKETIKTGINSRYNVWASSNNINLDEEITHFYFKTTTTTDNLVPRE